MAAQDVREFIPRVRRAIEGPVPLSVGALTDAQVEAMAADAIADIILLTVGAWNHKLTVTDRTDEGVPEHWAVDPGLELEEESVIAAQAAIGYFFHEFKDTKISERIVQEGRQWEYQLSATVIRDQVKLLQEQRDAALSSLLRAHPALARYASILEVRDRLGSAVLEQWTRGGLGGGQEMGADIWLSSG